MWIWCVFDIVVGHDVKYAYSVYTTCDAIKLFFTVTVTIFYLEMKNKQTLKVEKLSFP